MQNFPISADKSPNTVLEVITRLRVRDAMARKIHTARKTDTMRKIQLIMKANKISGVPITEEGRLVGMVSVDDILSAFDQGYIGEAADEHMTRKLVVLEDDMPLSFAISYFNKYPYHRFPVIDRERRLVGVISSRDVLTSLIRELDKEIQDLESRLEDESSRNESFIHREYIVKKFDFENAGHASYEIKKLLKEKMMPPKIVRRASVACYELEINVAIHSVGGRILFDLDDRQISITALDDGPGIEDVNQVLQEGYSTANEWIRTLGFGAGMGLPNTRRVSDDFDIRSKVGAGTLVRSVIRLDAPETAPEEGRKP